MSERVRGKLAFASPDYIRETLDRQMPRVLRGAVPELEMVSDGVVEAMVMQLLDGATSDQREAMYEMVLERMHKSAAPQTPPGTPQRRGDEMSDWRPIRQELPPEGVEVETKIHDAHGERNVQTLVRDHNLFFFPDRSMYVYYAPTHWRPLAPPTDATGEGS